MADDLSQDELELLMKGMLSEEKSKKLLQEKKEETVEEVEIKNQESIQSVEVEQSTQLDKSMEESTKAEEEIKEKKPSFIAAFKEKMEANKIKKAEKKASKETKSDENETNEVSTQIGSNVLVNKINNINTKTLTIILLVLLVFVIITGTLFGIQLFKKYNLEMQTKKVVTVPTYKPNTTNYIFINQEKLFNGDKLKLIKMLVDPIATVFYFDKSLDFALYEAHLKDTHGKMYNMDISFAESTTKNNEGSVLKFESLGEDIKEFTLTILDTNSSDIVEYTIVLNSHPEFLPPKYLSNSVQLNYNQDMQISLENATFSSSGSIIEYRLHWKDNLNKLRMGWQGISSSELVTLKERNINIYPTKNYPNMYLFQDDNTILGRMDFEAVKNLESTVDINFKNLYLEKNLNQRIDLTKILFSSKQSKEQIIPMDNYNIIIEGFRDFGDDCIVVYHVEDTLNLSTENRIETLLDGELIISDDSGVEVVLDGKCRAKQEGGDFTFNAKDAKDFIANLKNKVYILNLKRAGVKLPDETIRIDLSTIDETTIQMDKKEVKDFVVEAFKKRLAVKSGEADIEELKTYFEPYILKDDIIIRDYLQNETFEETPQYSSHILNMGKNDKGEYLVVVQDSWKGNTGVKEIYFYRTHKIIVQKDNDNFIIIEDNTIVK